MQIGVRGSQITSYASDEFLGLISKRIGAYRVVLKLDLVFGQARAVLASCALRELEHSRGTVDYYQIS